MDKGKPYRKSFKVSHTLEGLSLLLDFLEEVKRETGKKPPAVLEATGHYHSSVVQYLEDRGYLMIIINPLISYKAKSSSLRKVKTDAVDAYHLCELFYKEDLEPYKKRGVQLFKPSKSYQTAREYNWGINPNKATLSSHSGTGLS